MVTFHTALSSIAKIQYRLHLLVVQEFAGTSFRPGPVVQTFDSAIHEMKIYPVGNGIGFPNTYLLDSDLSGG